MTQPRGGLGKGLSALLPSRADTARSTQPGQAGPEGAVAAELRDLTPGEIQPNPRQPRKVFDDDALRELAASIRSVGLLQPIVVRPVEGGYELVAGERRWRASQLAGLELIPAIVRQTGDDALLRDALIENLQRADLNPLEEAAAFRQLVDDFGATHEEVAARVGKSRAAVTNSLRLLGLAPDVQQRITTGSLSAAHGRAIAALADPAAQTRAAQRVTAQTLSVRQTEELVRQMAGTGEAALSGRAIARRAGPAAGRPAGIHEAEALLSDILATRVTVTSGRGRGKVVIEFADLEDLDRIVRAIGPDENARTTP